MLFLFLDRIHTRVTAGNRYNRYIWYIGISFIYIIYIYTLTRIAHTLYNIRTVRLCIVIRLYDYTLRVYNIYSLRNTYIKYNIIIALSGRRCPRRRRTGCDNNCCRCATVVISVTGDDTIVTPLVHRGNGRPSTYCTHTFRIHITYIL